ncbi:hypothetical protein AMK68_05485 [candidate division KD3-62 bacterium DG_56]|uniref:ARG and Rhodanese-Phosphatase-superfamily-associated domain-containing protein n=1 Tax=candidate division KD3-62 bacterium DG_56 TaxID=1704032 RepID=A0A0S7XHW5_9BACT|nr:MAG: hypothetical protein AMK68_05485 [candidate division KD3-62 bacterium DG_56]
MTRNARAALAMAAGMLVVLFAALASGQIGRRDQPAPPWPIPDDEISAMIDRAQVEEPRQHRGLTVFPVVIDGVPNIGDLLTLDEALRKDVLKVSEFNGGNVNKVWMHNRSRQNVLGIGGEAVQGAKQDRMLRDDVLIPPQSKLAVPVYCVERNRWAGKSDEFALAQIAAQPSLRAAARVTESQEQVWAVNEANQKDLSVDSTTRTLADVYASPRVKADMESYLEALGELPNEVPNMCGAVIAVRGEIVCADVFGDPDICRRLWPKLLRSYVADDLGKGRTKRSSADRQRARRFLERARDARRMDREHVGAGRSIALRGEGIRGAALAYAGTVIHLELFPGIVKWHPLPEPPPRGLAPVPDTE